MVDRRTPPTRHSLLKTNEELKTATRGLTILERRRKRLVSLVMALLDRWKEQRGRLDAGFVAARQLRDRALELEGAIALRSAALAREDHAEVLFLTQELQGVPIPLVLARGITKRLDERGYGILGTTSAIDETAASHEEVLELVVRQAELTLALRVLLARIRQLTVRTNALRHRLVPELEGRKRSIEEHLAEREREERLIQRFIKRKRDASRHERHRGGASDAPSRERRPGESDGRPE